MNPRGTVNGLDVLAIARSGTEGPPLADAQRTAFARVYEEHAQAIYRYLLARVGRGELAEELTAQTFLAALQGFASYRGTGTQLAWLIGIARRKVVDEHRQRRRERPLDDARSVAASDADSPDRVVLGRLAGERVLAILQRSTPERREAVSMRLFAGLTARETAALMGKSEAAVKMLVHRALRELRDGLSQEVRDV
jgi:RNA polymerase sigma-70 factor, ECF subfamily